jgi:hypothetical protein
VEKGGKKGEGREKGGRREGEKEKRGWEGGPFVTAVGATELVDVEMSLRYPPPVFQAAELCYVHEGRREGERGEKREKVGRREKGKIEEGTQEKGLPSGRGRREKGERRGEEGKKAYPPPGIVPVEVPKKQSASYPPSLQVEEDSPRLPLNLLGKLLPLPRF